jgi:hypothetical protein
VIFTLASRMQELVEMDFYANHLAQLQPSHQLTASEDICNAQGLKLLARGARLDEATLARLALQKLLKPLGDSVGIEGTLNGARMVEAFHELAKEYADGAALLRQLPLPLIELCASLDRQPLLCQRLTVMREVCPTRFRRTLFGTLLALGMTKTITWRGLSLPTLFIAAMARSIGLLHLPALLMHSEAQSSAEAQRQFESHPVVSHEMLRRSIDPVTADAILNQHEHLDGSGFPRGWRAGAPSHEAQLLGAADFIAWLCLEQVGSGAGVLGHALAPLRLLRQFWSGPIYHAAGELIQTLGNGCPPLTSESERPLWLAHLRERQQRMGQQLHMLLQQRRQAASEASQRQRNDLLDALHGISASSGLLSPEYERWIGHVQEQQLRAAYAEMDDAHLQLCCLEPLLQRAQLLCESQPRAAESAVA